MRGFPVHARSHGSFVSLRALEHFFGMPFDDRLRRVIARALRLADRCAVVCQR